MTRSESANYRKLGSSIQQDKLLFSLIGLVESSNPKMSQHIYLYKFELFFFCFLSTTHFWPAFSPGLNVLKTKHSKTRFMEERVHSAHSICLPVSPFYFTFIASSIFCCRKRKHCVETTRRDQILFPLSRNQSVELVALTR